MDVTLTINGHPVSTYSSGGAPSGAPYGTNHTQPQQSHPTGETKPSKVKISPTDSTRGKSVDIHT
jgi:hypothetical protein